MQNAFFKIKTPQNLNGSNAVQESESRCRLTTVSLCKMKEKLACHKVNTVISKVRRTESPKPHRANDKYHSLYLASRAHCGNIRVAICSDKFLFPIITLFLYSVHGLS